MENVSKVFDNPQINSDMETTLAGIQSDLNAPFVPNFFKVWGDAPESLQGIFPAMKHILANGSLKRTTKEMIILSISSMNGCHYCVAAHQAFAMMMGVSMETIQSLKADQCMPEGSDPKEQAAIAYALQLAKDPKSGTMEDIKSLKSLGFSKAEIMEIIAMSGMSVYYNHLADATGINIDEAFTGKE